MPKSRKVLFRDEMACIGCGHVSRGTFYKDPKSTRRDEEEIAEFKKGRDAVFEAIGWRKVPGGWKCNNCTGIRGMA